MTSFICGIQKEIIQMNLQNTKRLTDLEDNLWLPIHTAVFKMALKYNTELLCDITKHKKVLLFLMKKGKHVLDKLH